MKKSLLIVGLLMAMSLSAFAQYDGASFGFRLGPTFNWVGSSKGEADNQKVPVGFDLGFVFEYYFTENYAFVTGVNVNFLNGKYSFGDMRFVMALGCIRMRLTPEQAFNAVTLNGAYAMGISDSAGSITVGKRADFILTRPGWTLTKIPYLYQTPFIRSVFLLGQEYGTNN